MSQLILGIDGGNYNGNTVGPHGADMFRTAICDFFERNVKENFGDDDMEFEIEGWGHGFAGTLAENEDQLGAAIFGDSKAHPDTKVRILLAIHRYLEKFELDNVKTISIVMGQPIKTHRQDERDILVKMLKKQHDYTVNGVHRSFTIDNVGIAPEGSGAFWADPQEDEIKIIDVGSGTVNCAFIRRRKHINSGSDTFNFGMETTTTGIQSMARAIFAKTTKLNWDRQDRVLLCGGAANDIFPHLGAYYPNLELMEPKVQLEDGAWLELEPVFANAVGFYILAGLSFK